MEENQLKPGKQKRICLKLLVLIPAGFLTIFIAGFLMYQNFAPLVKLKEMTRSVQNDTVFIAKYDTSFEYIYLKGLVKEKCYLASLVKLSKEDSIQLVINLYDSIVVLSFKGIILKTIRMDHIRTSPLLNYMPLMHYTWFFSAPLKIEKQITPLVKEPVIERQAPKDTLEALLNPFQPDTSDQKPVFLILELQYGFRIVFEQEFTHGTSDYINIISSRLKYLIPDYKRHFSDFIHFRQPTYYPKITIKANSKDITSIYRALPEKAYVSVRF